MLTTKMSIRLRECAGWSESSLGVITEGTFSHIIWRGSGKHIYEQCILRCVRRSVRLCLNKNKMFVFKRSDQANESFSLRKHAYSNVLEISQPKKWKFSNSETFHISVQNIDCGYSLEPPRWGGSNEYPQSMFLNRNKKNNVYPCKPQFYYIMVGFKGVKII